MKLSDFGLCKPIDCLKLSTLNEDELLSDENLRESMDIDGIPDTKNARRWKSPHEQLQHWQMNRRTLVHLLKCLISIQKECLCHDCSVHFSLLLVVFISKAYNYDKIDLSLQAFSTVGTPDYIAPEVLLKKGYGMECDWYDNAKIKTHLNHVLMVLFRNVDLYLSTVNEIKIFCCKRLSTNLNYLDLCQLSISAFLC